MQDLCHLQYVLGRVFLSQSLCMTEGALCHSPLQVAHHALDAARAFGSNALVKNLTESGGTVFAKSQLDLLDGLERGMLGSKNQLKTSILLFWACMTDGFENWISFKQYFWHQCGYCLQFLKEQDDLQLKSAALYLFRNLVAGLTLPHVCPLAITQVKQISLGSLCYPTVY